MPTRLPPPLTYTVPVYIVDDDAAIGAELSELLESRGRTVSVFQTGDAFLEKVGELPPGCIILDYSMPGMDGLATQARLVELGALHAVIMLTGKAQLSVAMAAMRGGAIEFLEKPAPIAALIDAVAAASRTLIEQWKEHAARRGAEAILESMSSRERQVFDAMCAGDANKIIAYKLGLSPRTVEIYRHNVQLKCGATNIAGVIAVAHLAGQLDLDPETPA